MKTSFFTQRSLVTALGFTLLAGVVLPVSAQVAASGQVIVRSTNRTIATGTSAMRGDVDSVGLVTRERLVKALPAFWASTAPGKSYMIMGTMITRASDGSVTSNERAGPYKFNPQTSVDNVQANAPEFVGLLLGQYAAQSRAALAELEGALDSYFNSTRPGQGSGVSGGQIMRNSDGTATFTDGTIIFVFDPQTSALTVATMAPSLAAALTNYASAIEKGSAAGGYALRDPSNANQLINFDGRMYDTSGNALPNASPSVVASLFGRGNGGLDSTTSGASGLTNTASGSASGSGAGFNGSGNLGSTAGGVGGTAGNFSGSGSGSTAGSSSGTNEGMNSGSGSTAGSNSGTTGGMTSGSGSGSSAGTTSGSSGNSTDVAGGANSGSNSPAVPSGSTNTAGLAATGGNTGSSGSSTTSSVNGTGLSGGSVLSTGSAMGTTSTNFGSGSSTTTAPSGSTCHVFRTLNGGSSSTTCNN